MKRNLILAVLMMGTIGGVVDGRGFGGGYGGGYGAGPGGEGIEGTGELWANSINGVGGLWGDGAYGAGLPGLETLPGVNAAYGGFFSGPPQLGMSKGGGDYHPLAGEQAIGGPQLNVNAQRQQFVSSLAGMGIQTGGFRPGQFGPPPGSTGLPSDLGMHQAGGKGSHGSAGRAAGSDGAKNWSSADLRVFGNAARSDFRGYSLFSRGWFAQHANAWSTRGYVRDVWTGAAWADVNAWFGGELPNYEYTYGADLTYQDNVVYLNGRPIAAADKYYDSAVAIAQAGMQAKLPTDGRWLPLGVFEAIRSGEKSNSMVFQLAVNKAGVVRGNYVDIVDQNVQRVEGSVDMETQRAAWVVADRKSIVFDCVLFNLTRAETPVLVHLGKDKNEQWTLVRLQQKGGG